MRFAISILLILAMSACASTPLSQATHADLQAAAKYAQDHGYPARAAVWLAEDAKLTAIEAQIKACRDAISATALKPPDWPEPVGPLTLAEMAAEGVAAGAPAAVKANCAPLPLPSLPIPIKP